MFLRRNAKCYKEKSYHYQICHCFKVKTSFHEKLFQKKKIIVMDLCPPTFRSFVVQWSTKIAGCHPKLKPLNLARWWWKSSKISSSTVVDMCLFSMSCNDSVLNNNYPFQYFFAILVIKTYWSGLKLRKLLFHAKMRYFPMLCTESEYNIIINKCPRFIDYQKIHLLYEL